MAKVNIILEVLYCTYMRSSLIKYVNLVNLVYKSPLCSYNHAASGPRYTTVPSIQGIINSHCRYYFIVKLIVTADTLLLSS
jgi:hypothetical protein